MKHYYEWFSVNLELYSSFVWMDDRTSLNNSRASMLLCMGSFLMGILFHDLVHGHAYRMHGCIFLSRAWLPHTQVSPTVTLHMAMHVCIINNFRLLFIILLYLKGIIVFSFLWTIVHLIYLNLSYVLWMVVHILCTIIS